MAVNNVSKGLRAIKSSKIGQYVNKNYNHVALQFVNTTSSITNGVCFDSFTVGSLVKLVVDVGECLEGKKLPTRKEAPLNSLSYIADGGRKLTKLFQKKSSKSNVANDKELGKYIGELIENGNVKQVKLPTSNK